MPGDRASSAPSGATRARARSSTCSPSGPTWSCASRAATTPATRSSARRDVEVPPDPVRDPLSRQALRHRQRRRRRPARADRRDRRAAGAGSTSSGLRITANAHLIMPYHLLLDHGGRGEARQAPDRHDQARHRALLRRQGRAPRHPRAGHARREDPQEEDHRRARAQAPDAAPVRQGPGARPADDDRGVPDLRPPPRAAHRRHAALAAARLDDGSTSSSRAPRRRCSTSTTAPIRSSRPRTRSPAPPASAPASARGTSTRSGASPRPTRRASAPGRSRPSSTTRSARRSASAAASSARRPAARGAPAGSTSSRCATRRASTA